MSGEGNNYQSMTSTLFSFVRKFWYASIKAAAVFAILYFCTYSLVHDTPAQMTTYWVISALCFTMFAFFCYVDTWRKAFRDQNLVKYKYLEYNGYRGLIAGLLADIPGLVCIIFILITKSVGATAYVDIFKVGYFILYSPFVLLVSAFESTTNLIYFLPLLVPPITGAAGYYLGYRNIGVVTQFIYKTDRAKNKKLR